SKGAFARATPWEATLPERSEMEAMFQACCWPTLRRISDEESLTGITIQSSVAALNRAVNLALWDLKAKRHGVPVWRLLHDGPPHRVPTYGSPLDYPLDDAATLALCEQFLAMGCRTLKIKLGAADFDRDIH